MLVVWSIMALILVLVTPPTLAGSPPAKIAAEKLAVRSGLPLTPSIQAVVLKRIRQRGRDVPLGGLIGTVTGMLLGVWMTWSGHRELEGVVVLSFAGLGRALGGFHAALKDDTTMDARTPRVARLHAPGVADYSTKAEVAATRLSMVGVLVALVCAWVVWVLTPVRPSGGVMAPAVLGAIAVVGLATMVSMLGCTKRVVEQSRPARDDLELAWQDVLRSDGVRALQDASIITGLFVVLGLLGTAGSWVITPSARAHGMQLTLELGLTTGAVGIICWAVVLVPWCRGRQVQDPSRALRPARLTPRIS